MAWEIEETKEFDEWFDELDEDDQIQVIAARRYLAEHGPVAKMPVSAPIRQPNSCAMKELRPGSKGRTEIRILYAFDHRRTAVLLLAGDKAAIPGDWDAWYDRNVPQADRLFAERVAVMENTSGEQADVKRRPKLQRERGRRER